MHKYNEWDFNICAYNSDKSMCKSHEHMRESPIIIQATQRHSLCNNLYITITIGEFHRELLYDTIFGLTSYYRNL